ncbi:MAG TPA: riboflavin synthase [Candidatus Acidoferrum sp.]|nr:riboflavin synthase [Candidatus Acidoferrum sp.]
MFTGIIEHVGTIESLSSGRSGGRITIHAPSVALSLAISNSVAVNGCCLTVASLDKERFSADLSGETLAKTSFSTLKPSARVNLERPLTAGKEFGGHFVLGHVDGIGRVTHLTPEGDNWWLGVQVPEDFARYIVPKGSVTIDGISLTVARWHNRIAEVAVIPCTYEQTNLRDRKPGDAVNLEGDILGKYVERYLEAREAPSAESITLSRLIEEGF